MVGAGPAGLSAAYYLRIKGISVDLLDAQELPGGSLRYHLPEGLLDQTVLDAEISYVLSTGVNFRPGVNLGKESFAELQQTYDAVVLATGNVSEAQSEWGLKQDGKQFLVDKGSFQTSVNNVFAIGNANRPGKLAIRSAAQGKEVAFSVEQLLLGQSVTGEFKRFNSTIGKLYPDEYAEYLQQASKAARTDPEDGLSRDLVMQEAARCMDCDCRKIDSCLLREHSERFRIARRRFAYSERVRVSRKYTSDLVVYEPGKCIKCGICVRLTAKYNETFGFTYIGRGFDVVIGVPFDASLELALEKTATKVVEACPTGALGRLNRKP